MFLGYLWDTIPKKGIWETVERTNQLRALARQVFGLSENQSVHPRLCFKETMLKNILQVHLYDV